MEKIDETKMKLKKLCKKLLQQVCNWPLQALHFALLVVSNLFLVLGTWRVIKAERAKSSY